MELGLVFAIAVGFFVTVAVLIFSVILKRKKEAWTGTVQDKKVVEETRKNDGMDSKVDVYYLYSKLTDGSTKKMSVSKKLWDTFEVGDKIEKKSGSYNPVKA